MFTEESLLAELVGRELSSIEFVRDYLQFRFDGPTLTVLTSPTVTRSGSSFTEGTPGYRDELVMLIGKEVSETHFKRDEAVVVVFRTDEVLRVPLDRASRPVPGEAIVLDFNDEARRTVVA